MFFEKTLFFGYYNEKFLKQVTECQSVTEELIWKD